MAGVFERSAEVAGGAWSGVASDGATRPGPNRATLRFFCNSAVN